MKGTEGGIARAGRLFAGFLTPDFVSRWDDIQIGMIESLNLGTSSGIVLYEVAKQRREYQSRYAKRNRRVERAEPLPTTLPPREGR